MGIRQNISKKQMIPFVAAGAIVLALAVMLVLRSRPARQLDTSVGYYSDDDGQTWFVDSSALFPPFDHNGKTAVVAHIYTYAGGSKTFCAYLSKYTDEAKRRLEASSAEAKAKGDPTGAPALFGDLAFMANAGLVKLPGPNHPWIPANDPRSADVCAARSPDGSAVDVAVIY